MSTSINVLCPSGHTITAKVGPNEPILKILEIVCTKRKLDQEKHYLLYNKKRLDNTCILRFANLPNHARVELIELSEEDLKSNSGKSLATIALQLPNGKRVQSTIDPNKSLQDYINYMENEAGFKMEQFLSSSQVPEIVYMRREITGIETMQKTSLKSLGILPATKALLRLNIRSLDCDRSTLPHHFVEAPKKTIKVVEKESKNIPKSIENKPIESSLNKKEPIEDKDFIEKQPLEPKDVEEKKQDFGEEKKQSTVEEKKKDIIEESIVPKEIDPKPEPMEIDCNNSKTDVETCTESLKDHNIDSRKSQPEPEPEPEVIHYLDEENKVLVFKMDSIKVSSFFNREVDDDFFELTQNEVSARQAELTREAKRLQEGEMLLTSHSRNLMKSSGKSSNYKETILRVQFRDYHVIQICLEPQHKILDVINIIKKYIDKPNAKFDLFSTPPKTILERNKSLLELNCVPLATVRISSEENILLRNEYLNKLSNFTGAQNVSAKVTNFGGIKKRQISDEDLNKKQQKGGYKKVSLHSNDKKVPAWFMKGKQ